MGKSSGGTTGFKYFMDLHFLAGLGRGGSSLASAVKDALLGVVIGGRSAWEGEQTENGTIQIYAPDLFGGDEKEGGIEASVEVMFGGATQDINPYLLSVLGAPQSAHRGLFGLLVKKGHVASNNPYVKPWTMLRRRITGDWYGGECWHEAKAPIPLTPGAEAVAGSGTYRWAFKMGAVPLLSVSADGIDWTDSTTYPAAYYTAEVTIPVGTNLVAISAGGTTRYADWTNLTWVDGPAAGPTTGLLSPNACTINGRTFVARGASGWSRSDNPTLAYQQFDDDATFFLGNSDFVVRCLMAGATASFDRSADGGETFEPGMALPHSFDPDEADYALDIYAGAASDSVYAVGGKDYHGNPVIFRSTDGFMTSARATLPDGLEGTIYELFYRPSVGWLAFMNNTSGGDGALLKSIDDAASFQVVELGLPVSFGQTYQGNVALDARDGRLLIAAQTDTGGRIFQTDDYVLWNEREYVAAFGPATIMCIAPEDSGIPAVRARWCMNPAHVIYQCLTDPENGLGYPAAVIDEPSFIKAADQLYAEGLGVNLGWNVQTSIEDFIAIAQDHAGGMMVRDRRTGLFKFKLLRKDYVKEDLPIYGPHNCRILGDSQRPSPADVVNELQVTYTDYRDGEEKTTTVRNVAAQQAVGRIISKTHSLTGLPTEALAQRCGMRDLDAMSLPLWRFDLEFFRSAAVLEPGDVFRFIWPPLGLDIVLRVPDELNYGNAAGGRVRGKVIEDVFALPDSVYTGSVGDPNPGPNTQPLRAESILVEAPYRDLVQALSPAKLASLESDAAFIGAVAVRANQSQTTFELHTRIAPADFTRVATGDFAGTALLSAAVAPLDAALPVSSEVDTARLEVGSAALLGEGERQEIVRIVSVSPGMIGVARACGDTVPNPDGWPVGTRLWGYDNYGAADPNEYMAGETIQGKVYSRSPAGLSDDADALSITPQGRAAWPYPPGQVRTNGVLVYAGSSTIPPPIDPQAPPGTAPGGTTPNGSPASTRPGPHGGYADDGEIPVPLPTASGANEIGGDGNFSNPGALATWTQQNGAPLDPAKWSTVGDRARCFAPGVNRAFYRAAEQTMPWMPLPRYVVTVTGYLKTDLGTKAALGVGLTYNTQPGVGGDQHSPLAEYPSETLVTYVRELAPEMASYTYANTFVVQTIMPMLHHESGITPGEATFKLVTMKVEPVPFDTTEQFPAHLELDVGLGGWGIFPNVAPSLFGISVNGDGELTMAPTLDYAHECVVYCKDPLTSLDEAGKYARLLAEVLVTDPTTRTSRLGITTTGGVSLGLVSVGPDGQVIGRWFYAYERGDWTLREAWHRCYLPNGTAGITLHAAAHISVKAGRVAKIRNWRVFTTDTAQD